MPVEQIYVVEMIVNSIQLEPGIRIKNIDELTVSFKFAQLINFDVDTLNFSSPEIEDDSDDRNILMNYGKTFLFISKPSVLRQLLQTEPYHIYLYDGNKCLGSATAYWKREFGEMVKFFESLGIVKSTTLEDVFELRAGELLNANIFIFIRMSCFGQNVQTMFQITTEGRKQEYLFRQRNSSRTFKVEKHYDDRHQPLVAPLYTGITDVRDRAPSQVNVRENVSLTQLFQRDYVSQKESAFHPPDAGGEEGIRLDFQDDMDKVSICFRPSENKFFDLLNLISADVKTREKQTEVTIQKKKIYRMDSFLKSIGAGGIYKSVPNIVIEEEEDIDEMTADKIAKKLCGNKDCPAVKKFKEYGIGPLATGTSLGTVYGDVEPPVTYGISHTYGTMREYGPYGVFSKPKQEELPFVPDRAEADPPVAVPCKISRKEAPCSAKNTKRKKTKKSPKWHSHSCPLCPERLKGGADDETMVEQQEKDEDGVIMPKSPILECKGVMDQFDTILAEYKKAIGPCGHATCPYAQNLAEDTCKKMCEEPPPPAKDVSSVSCNDAPCDVDGCPYAGEPKKKRYPAGCGSPKCAYTKYKLGLLDDDAELELKFLPPALGGNCGEPNCKYPLAPPLPPIHWDCPDPLPRGPCRNLNCPFQPAPLKKFKTKKQLKTGPCGSPMCPYAFPQPCGVPTCPFAMNPCPMSQQQDRPKERKEKEASEENLCENPDCPYSEKNADKDIENEVDDPKFKGEFQDCANPDCPYKETSKKKKSKKQKPRETACGNPTCPFLKPEKKSRKKNKEKPESEETSICSNPECPAREKTSKRDKNRCQKSSSSETVSVCSDPECPYAPLKKMQMQKRRASNATDKSGEKNDFCSKRDEDSVCSNSECPERKDIIEKDEPSSCNIPSCPYSKKVRKSEPCNDPNCPYLQPLPSCGIPNCPYEPVPLRFSCENPKCPSKSVDFSKKIGKSKLESDMELRSKSEQDSKGPENLKQTTECEDDAPCEPPVECENPDCEMKEDEQASPTTQRADQNKEIVPAQPKKKGKRKKKGKFVYSIGDTYPGTKLGHRECVTPVFNVPPHMGWLWNIFTPMLRLKPRRGWRPGALTKTIAARIRAHRQAKGLGYLRVPTFKKDGTHDVDGDPKVVPKPTLQIQKKEGAYWITMNPLKDPYTLVENEDPYMDCTPMTFKITKNKKPQEEYCYCDGEEPMGDDYESSSSSDSELDIEFTPPAGIIHPERFKKRPNVACCEAQYDPKDFEVSKKEAKKGKGKGGKEGKGKGKGKGKGGGKKGKGGKKKK